LEYFAVNHAQMRILKRDELKPHALPGRVIQKAVGKDAESRSCGMTMGFAHYSEASGPMEPHHHAEEIVYVLRARNGWLRYGPGKDDLPNRVPLASGMTLHVPALEWHVFEYEPGGEVDILFFYGQVDNIRPEEMNGH
jgi:hypothetical protein